MFSLVSVYNNQTKLEARLQAGLARQTVPYQLICVDNREARFAGAAAALNHGATQATGEWIIFLHQDVELLGADWLERAEGYLRRLDAGGWHGVVGRTAVGRWRGLLRDRDMVFGEPFAEPLEVQTLDEIVLIHRNRGPGHVYFDEGVPGWHAYGVDVCCGSIRAGSRNFILPLPVWHDSASTNIAGLKQAHAYVWAKHASAFRRIYTTCGVLPHPYGWSGSYKISTFLRRVADWRHFAWMRRADRNRFQRTPWEVLEELTAEEPTVYCYHRPFVPHQLEGVGFADRAGTAAGDPFLYRPSGTARGNGLCGHRPGSRPRPPAVLGAAAGCPAVARRHLSRWLPKPDGLATGIEARFDCHLAAELDGTPLGYPGSGREKGRRNWA